MMTIDRRRLLLSSAALALAPTLANLVSRSAAAAGADPLETMAESKDTLWNGITITPDGRKFVALPNWLGPSAGAGEIGKDGVLRPWPGNEWNAWKPESDPTKTLVSVNAVRLNPKGDELWVVDSGAPLGGKRLPGGSKLVVFDVATGAVKKVHALEGIFEEPNAAPNDIRIHGNHAFVSESGVGSIVLLDLTTDKLRRVLVKNPLLVMDPAKRPVVIDGQPLKNAAGKPFGTNANQLEVSPDGRWFYIQPLNGGMSRIEVALLTDPSASEAQLTEGLKFFAETPPLSGTAIDAKGNLYLNSVNDRSIKKLTPEGTLSTVLSDPRLRWADAPWITPDGYLWLPIAQLGWTPMLNGGTSKLEWPSPLYRMRLPAA
ncbi:major royal jelly family protein [Starkeya koreensis]|uniref:Major royal jelly family protein n=1 Tax=Ancylobacter koreensis TaxID=266121 RepID=A0ABT0DQP3_9HYPH|nr:major royal jelly family protein [Ancylobacter koreensis]MCK0209608.1 major royal jelly family protein [Ancylobacter koreensis]